MATELLRGIDWTAGFRQVLVVVDGMVEHEVRHDVVSPVDSVYSELSNAYTNRTESDLQSSESSLGTKNILPSSSYSTFSSCDLPCDAIVDLENIDMIYHREYIVSTHDECCLPNV